MDAKTTTPYFQENKNFQAYPTIKSTLAAMNEEDTVMNISDDELSEDNIEFELNRGYDNAKQLGILRREIRQIVAHKILPSEGWYNRRFEYINTYSQLGWIYMAQRFHNKDLYIHNTALYIMRLLDELHEERGTKPTFNITIYHRVIHEIQNIWSYYSRVYMDDEEDINMADLIEGMTFLCK